MRLLPANETAARTRGSAAVPQRTLFQRIMNFLFRQVTLPDRRREFGVLPAQDPELVVENAGASGLPVVHPRLCQP
ncbi:hypothetical protein [Kibdelosporangium philippinense]|uniref:hypothetical protein n=1 Tax=Kibdelosporangium philippinense TaxID=211113 RepID=UPI00361068BA